LGPPCQPDCGDAEAVRPPACTTAQSGADCAGAGLLPSHSISRAAVSSERPPWPGRRKTAPSGALEGRRSSPPTLGTAQRRPLRLGVATNLHLRSSPGGALPARRALKITWVAAFGFAGHSAPSLAISGFCQDAGGKHEHHHRPRGLGSSLMATDSRRLRGRSP